MEPGEYRIKIKRDTLVGGGLPPYWFWSVSYGMRVASDCTFTKWGAKLAAARYVARLEKARLSEYPTKRVL